MTTLRKPPESKLGIKLQNYRYKFLLCGVLKKKKGGICLLLMKEKSKESLITRNT